MRNGLFEARGTGSFGNIRGPSFPLEPVQASGFGDVPSEGRYWGQVLGPVTKRASRVRVAFHAGIGPARPRADPGRRSLPVNFYVGFYGGRLQRPSSARQKRQKARSQPESTV